MAEAYYGEGDFRRAKGLFEQLKPIYRGKPQSERITYFYANCLLNTKSYISAAYEFESFTKTFPNSEKLEEAYYLVAYAYAEISPVYSLDQKDTEKGLSFNSTGDLNMRIGLNNFSADDVINKLDAKELEKIFKFFGEEREAKKIALKITHERKVRKIDTKRLVEIIEKTKKKKEF